MSNKTAKLKTMISGRKDHDFRFPKTMISGCKDHDLSCARVFTRMWMSISLEPNGNASHSRKRKFVSIGPRVQRGGRIEHLQ